MDHESLLRFLETSYTAYQAVENAERMLKDAGFCELSERDEWRLRDGGKYYVVRGESSLIAFTVGGDARCKIVASHTDSPCLKLKERPALKRAGFTVLNAETYGGGILYSFFDRPLKLAGRVVKEVNGALRSENAVSPFCVVVPSLAIHMNREVNDKFAPNPQTDLLPLFSAGEGDPIAAFGNPVSYDLYAVCAEKPFLCGEKGEFLCSPRIDNLTSVYISLRALCDGKAQGICVAACLDSEEVGSRTLQGAGSDFLSHTLLRIAQARGCSQEEFYRAVPSSFLLSLDNAHSVHPNRPEKCDPTNQATMGKGVVIKMHADRAYTTDALTSAVVKTVFRKAGVPVQTFFNRSDMRSGGTLGAISLGQIGIPSADIGLAQLAMHSAVETVALSDCEYLEQALRAYYASDILISDDRVEIR